ncbi:MAG: PIG-L family deacetylase [Candidatus Omnitrophica bacterium]|nr:PIG-L family deacetylase [Candidatus Omnitrophota bacterium]
MRLLCVHAHFDDFEFVAAGTFELWKRKPDADVKTRLLVCTDGQGGHYCRTREETGRIRLEEQAASARIGGYEFEPLRLPDGRVPRETFLESEPFALAALWQSIRCFEPDYLFCPPVVSDPLAGVHVDHAAVAEAVRKVAYLINVPHAFTPEYPADERVSQPCKVPVILSAFDSYSGGANQYDFAVDVEEAFPRICAMSYCHQSQIAEWLPWIGRHQIEPPKSLSDWSNNLRRRFARRNAQLGISSAHPVEAFSVTAWGTVPTAEQLARDFPNIRPDPTRWDGLKRRLDQWRANLF